jgi:NAD(P)H-dependent flavin oxidoreductase YrpB (nitropropane dioxygenase family)
VSPQRVDAELQWIDDHISGRPYGVDVLMPTTFQDAGEGEGEAKYDADRLLPAEHLAFVRGMLDRAGVPALPAAEAAQIERDLVSTFNFTPGASAAAELVQRAHARGIKVAAMAGAPKHAIKHRDAGCDFVIAVGTEAGGHIGSTTSMVLWPRIVDAVAPLPVLGAGGIGRGRQLASALALGCEGAWCSSVWLKTVQSEVTPEQAILWWGQGRTRVERVRAKEFLTYPVGQIVADMREETSVRQVVQDMLGELAEAKERLDRLLG